MNRSAERAASRRKRSGRPAWMPAPRPSVRVAKAITLTLVVVMVVLPFWVVIATSFASPEQLNDTGFVLWPSAPTLEAYRQVLGGGIVTQALKVSAGVTIVGTTLSLLCTIGLAYALARPDLYGGKPLMLMVLFTFLFPPGIIPGYLVVKQLGLLNSYAALIAPVLVNVFNLVIMRAFFQGIPEDIYAAARLDGAGEFRILTRVVLPLSKAVVAVVGLFYAVSYWNSFFSAVLYLDDNTKWPLQAVLRLYVIQGAQLGENVTDSGQYIAPQSIQMAAVVIATVPILCVYPFVQRYFAKGVLTGAVKA